jgi:hypothetical protein
VKRPIVNSLVLPAINVTDPFIYALPPGSYGTISWKLITISVSKIFSDSIVNHPCT